MVGYGAMPSAAVEQIKQRIDIVELLQEYLRLTKAGTNWKTTCPFHHEKSASFVVSPDKQIWHCFGCGKGGDIFTFIQEIEGMEFPEALRSLAQRAGVELEQYRPEEQNQRTVLLDIVKQTQRWFSETLQQQPTAQIARDYIQQRGITPAMQQQFGLGYSYNEWRKLSDHLHQLGYSDQDLLAAGVITKSPDKPSYYDRFRGRLMFPIMDQHGNTVGFTARVLTEDTTGGKYINSPQSTIYDKSRMIYGLNFAKQSIKRLNATIVVEGNMDVISCHQAGFTNTVAVSGTAFTEAQILLLKRYSPNLLLAFDMDVAGVQAAQRSIAAALQHDMNIKVVRLPSQYKDPDECIQQDATAFKQAIREAKHIMDFWFDSVTAKLDLSRVEHKKQTVQKLLPVLQFIHDSVEQAHYVQKLANLVQVNEEIIRQKIHQPIGTRQIRSRRELQSIPTTNMIPKDRFTLLAQQVVAILVGRPQDWSYAVTYLLPDYIPEPTLAEVYKRMTFHYNSVGEFASEQYLAQHPNDRSTVATLELLYDELATSLITPEQWQREVVRGITELHKAFITKRLQSLEWQLKQAELSHDQAAVHQLLQDCTNLTSELTSLFK